MKHLDPSILTAGVPVSALRAEPMSTAEIDAHPDAARIWATIRCLRDLRQEGYDEGYADAEDEFGGEKDGSYDDAVSDVDDRIHALLREMEGDISEGLSAKILALTEGLAE